jgi:hypothetical protein
LAAFAATRLAAACFADFFDVLPANAFNSYPPTRGLPRHFRYQRAS